MPDFADVLVVGGGNAGLCAAIAAAEKGAHVVLVEVAPQAMRGGNTRHTRNLRAMHSTPTATLTHAYTEEEYWADLLRVTGGKTDETLARIAIKGSYPLMSWLEERGVRFQAALSGTLSLGRTNAFFLGGGKALVNAQYRAARALCIEVFYEAEATDLEFSDEGFQSAKISMNGQTHEINASALVVASGGFQSNEAWMEEIWGSAARNFLIRGTPYNKGRMLQCLMDHGAQTVSDPSQCHAVAIDARGPKYDGGIVTRLDCVCFSVVVDMHGQRFYDEGEDFWPKRYAIWGRLIADRPDQIAYAIIDAKVERNFMPSVFPAISADSIESLAEKIDLEPSTLATTISEFNKSVVPGAYDPTELDDCHTEGLSPPKSHWALPLDTAPFSAYPLRPGITFTYFGVAVDSDARVRFDGERPARNVYAAGEIMAGNILGQGYCAGTGMTIGGVFGRIAGENAAEHREE